MEADRDGNDKDYGSSPDYSRSTQLANEEKQKKKISSSEEGTRIGELTHILSEISTTLHTEGFRTVLARMYVETPQCSMQITTRGRREEASIDFMC